ncbi:hypothetical protein L6452_00236 [Arctium lappa]|uniref:Uncharacterized protein n=1 Tax=Arctium lappa TaxID=4217 RepID=A0ACB9FEL3_ARCLA|nr:hypothetical protein L6452_00236 [Arctium lappa]
MYDTMMYFIFALFSSQPPKIRCFINGVIATPLENIEEPLKSFVWDFDKGDFHHWVNLFNYFDTFFEKYIKSRKDLLLEDDFLEHDPPFPREAVLQILRVVRIILDNCTNKHFSSPYEHHLSSLLASTDVDVVEACLQTLAAFLKKSTGKYVIGDASLTSKLFAFAQGWGGKEEGLGLVACAIEDGSDSIAQELGSTLHFEFYLANESLMEHPTTEQQKQGLQIIHLPNVNTYQQCDRELMQKLIKEYKVPHSLRFSLLTRLRFARAFGSSAARLHYTCIQLHAFVVFVQACGDNDDLVTFFDTEPEFINELVTLLSYEDAAPAEVRILCLLSLVALCQDRSRQLTVLSAVTSGGHRGILSSLTQKAVDAVLSKPSKWFVVFAEALISLVTILVSSPSGCSAMREAGFIPTLLPLLKDTDPQHLHLVSSTIHVLEAFMDSSNSAAVSFQDLGGFDDTIFRLKVEVSHVKICLKQQGTSADMDSSGCSSSDFVDSASSDLDSMQPLYSEALVSYHRRSLMKALLRVISLGTYATGITSHVNGSEEKLLPHCLCVIFRKAKTFGGRVFSLAAIVMSNLIHKDPTCFPLLEAAGLPSAFLGAIMDGVLCSSEAITCIPQCLDALCLSNIGLQAVKDHNALRCFVKIFTTRTYLRALTGDTPSSLSRGLDELLRHASSLRVHGVDVLIEILKAIEKIGYGPEAASSTIDATNCLTSVSMETDAVDKACTPDDEQSGKNENSEKLTESSADTSLLNVESFLPDCINNVARLFERILQNSDTCRVFLEKKGVEAILQLFTLPLMPSSVSVGQSIAVAFKHFSPHHCASLARILCSFMRQHLILTNEILISLGGMQLTQVEDAKRTHVLRCLSSLEGILSLSCSLAKGTTNVVSELGTSNADLLRDLGATFREILWQHSMCCDSKIDEKQCIKSHPENVNATVADAGNAGDARAASNTVGTNVDDVTIPVVRSMNPVSVQNSSHPHSGLEQEFLSVARTGEGFSRHNRHALSRIRGGRTSRHLEALQIDSESLMNNTETTSQDLKRKSPEALVLDNLIKLASTLRSFFIALVKGFTSSNRRRAETGSLSAASKSIGTALAKVFLEALSFPGYATAAGLDTSLSLKGRYLGKVVNHLAAVTFDSRHHTCSNVMINNFYVQGTFKELLNTFEATSQLLWTLPYSASTSGVDHEKSEGSKLSHNSWLLNTLERYCHVLEVFVNSTFLLPPASTSQAHLVLQPVAVGLSIGLFPVPRDPKVFVRMLQSQVLDAILPVWNHPMFPCCNPGFITGIVTLLNHVYCGVADAKFSHGGGFGGANQRLNAPLPDEATISTIVEMGFTRTRAEEALRHVERNSVESAMEWLFSHAEDHVQEDDELAQALALSLGSSSETPKADTENLANAQPGVVETKAPPIGDILAVIMKLFRSSDSITFPLTDLLITLCTRDKGEERPKVILYLIQQLKLCSLETPKDTGVLCITSHTLALLLAKDVTTREVAAENGIVSVVIDLLIDFKARKSQDELLVSKCISALLLILDNLLQSRPNFFSDSIEGTKTGSLPGSMGEKVSPLAPQEVADKNLIPAAGDKETNNVFGKVFGNTTGYLTVEEGNRVLTIVCDMIKQHAPAVVMHAVLLLGARLTKTHSLALHFLENGGMVALFSIPRTCSLLLYDTVASAIIRHLIEDPHTLQTAMELEIRQTLTASHHAGRIPPRTFLTSMAPLISRDPEIFLKAAAAICQLESSGGRNVVLSKEKEKEKDKSKVHGVEIGASSSECVRIPENKSQDGPVKSKNQKKISANLTQVIHHMLEIIMKYPSLNPEEECTRSANAMEIDEPATSKGKSMVDEMREESDKLPERSAEISKVTFLLKLLSDILLMYVHAGGIVLKRDLEMGQLRGHGGIVHHIMHRILHSPVDKNSGSDDLRAKLSEKASGFLVVLCGRSSEGGKHVINELVKGLRSFSNSASNSSKGNLLPDKKLFAFVHLLYSILSKYSSSSNLLGSGCSPDIAKGMIDGGMIPCLSSILQVLDLDHPDAPKVVNIIIQVLEGLIRAANASEQFSSSDLSNKKKSASAGTRSDNQMATTEINQTTEPNLNSHHEVTGTDVTQQLPQRTSQDQGDDRLNLNQPAAQEMRAEMETETIQPYVELGMGFMHEEMEDGGVLHNSNQSEMAFHVDNRGGNNTGDEDDDMGDDGEDDDVDGDDEGEDLAMGGNVLRYLATTDVETDVEDDDETAMGDEYNDDMVDEQDGDYHENRVTEVRWREALMQVFGQQGADSGLIDMATEPPEGVNVHGLLGDRRPLGLDRRRQRNRITFEAPVLPFDHVQSGVFGDRVGGVAPPSGDFSVGLESLYTPGRRGLGESRWTDDGQPQAGGQAAAIAQAVEEQFMSRLHNTAPSSLAERQPYNSATRISPSDAPLAGDNQLVAGLGSGAQKTEGHHGEIDQRIVHLEMNHTVEGVIDLEQVHSGVAVEPTEDLQAHGPSLNVVNASSNGQDNMEIGGDGSVNQQELQRDSLSATDNETRNHQVVTEGDNVPNSGDYHAQVEESTDVDMNIADSGANENGDPLSSGVDREMSSSSEQNTQVEQDNSHADQSDETGATNVAPNTNGIDPTFLEALPEDLRAEVLASQQVQSTPALAVSPAVADDIDPEFLAALPPDIQAEVLAQQRAQRIAQQAEGQPVDMDNASIIATLPADLRREVLLTSSEAVLSALPSPLLAEAQMLRDRAMSHYRAQSLFGSNQRLNNRRDGLGLNSRAVIDRGVGITIGRKASYTLAESLKVKEVEGEPLLDTDALKAFIRLLRLAKHDGEGLLQRLLLNLCAHGCTRAILVYLLLDMIKPETKGPVGGLTKINSKRLYGCQPNVVYGRSQLIDGLPPLVLRRVLEILTYLAINHSCVADILFYFDTSHFLESLNPRYHDKKNNKGKEKVIEGCEMVYPAGLSIESDVPILLFVKLLNHGIFLRSTAHLEQVLGLLQVVVYNAALKLDHHSQRDSSLAGAELGSVDKSFSDGLSTSDDNRSVKMYDIFMKLPQADLLHLCSLLGHRGLSDKVYTLTGKVLKKLASIASLHRKFFIVELSNLAHNLSSSAIHELMTLRSTKMLGLSAGSMAGASVLRILQTLNSLTVLDNDGTKGAESDGNQEHVTMWRLNASLEPLWQELSECISVTELQLGEGSFSSIMLNANVSEHAQGSSSLSPPLPPGTQRLLPFIEAFMILCEKLQKNSCLLQQDHSNVTASEVKQLTSSSSSSGMDSQRKTDGVVTFDRFAEKHRRLLNAFVRQNPRLLEKSFSMLLKAPRLMDFDNKRSYFRSRFRQRHEQHLAGPLQISVRRAYILEDSYNQLRMRSSQDMKRQLNVHFQGEEGIDAGGLTREWYQSLSRVIFDKGALLFTTVGNNATFQPNPNSVYQTEHLSYFKFVGRVVAKALFDGQLLDVYFTRSFYKHILGVKVTYHDIEAVDPDYYKNLKWMLENDVSDIPDLTFSMDADEEKHILYEKTEVTDYELKPGGRNIRVTEETKHEYVDLVAEHILTNAIRPQINSFLEGFNELIPRESISIFNDKELELLINGLPEIDFDDMKANTEYTGYTAASSVIIWFWEVVEAFNKEDRARLLQFVTGTSKVPLEGFRALQGLSGPQNFQIHKAYGAPERLPSAHTCFNQLDLPEYMSKEQLQERLLLAIHEASEGFGFG